MRNSSDIPPQCDTYATVTHRSAQDNHQQTEDGERTSGWAIEIARASKYGRKSLREKRPLPERNRCADELRDVRRLLRVPGQQRL